MAPAFYSTSLPTYSSAGSRSVFEPSAWPAVMMVLRKAWDLKRSPNHREHESGGSLEIIGALEHGAGLSRTAEIVIIDELRAFTADLLQEINDRMAAFGTKGRMITASSAGFQDQCKTSPQSCRNPTRGNGSCVCPNCERESIAQWECV